jgi:hypothetical protein
VQISVKMGNGVWTSNEMPEPSLVRYGSGDVRICSQRDAHFPTMADAIISFSPVEWLNMLEQGTLRS